MSPEEQGFLRDLFRALEDRPLDPDDPAYIGLYDDPTLELEDPVALLARSIQWAPRNTSAQLLSGFRGAGKSTELRRLRRDLTDDDYLVVLFDVFDYLSPSSAIDVSDFVMVLAGALSDKLDKEQVFKPGATHESYWTRWLQRIADTHDASLDDISRLPRLVTFLDSHLVLCYRNSEEWYDVHPLVREEVARLAAANVASAPAAPAASLPAADEASDP